MDVPNVKRTEYTLVSHSIVSSPTSSSIYHVPQVNIDDDFLNLMDDNGAEKNDVHLPDGEIGQLIKAAFDKSESGGGADVRVTIVAAMGEEQAISFKEVAGDK